MTGDLAGVAALVTALGGVVFTAYGLSRSGRRVRGVEGDLSGARMQLEVEIASVRAHYERQVRLCHDELAQVHSEFAVLRRQIGDSG